MVNLLLQKLVISDTIQLMEFGLSRKAMYYVRIGIYLNQKNNPEV